MTRHWTSTASELVCIPHLDCIVYATVLSYELIRTMATVRQTRWLNVGGRVDRRSVDAVKVNGRAA